MLLKGLLNLFKIDIGGAEVELPSRQTLQILDVLDSFFNKYEFNSTLAIEDERVRISYHGPADYQINMAVGVSGSQLSIDARFFPNQEIGTKPDFWYSAGISSHNPLELLAKSLEQNLASKMEKFYK